MKSLPLIFLVFAISDQGGAESVAPGSQMGFRAGDSVFLNSEFKFGNAVLPEQARVEILASVPDLEKGGRNYLVKDESGRRFTIWENPSSPSIFSVAHRPNATEPALEYVYINSHGYPLKTVEDFRSGHNIAFTAAQGSVFEVLRSTPTETGRSLLVRDDRTGEKYWMFDSNLPARRNQLVRCRKMDCSDISNAIPSFIQSINSKPDCVSDAASPLPGLRSERPFERGPCISLPGAMGKPNFSAYKKNRESAEKFIDWILPFAKLIQENTGLPASVIIAQAAIETGWGRSKGYRDRNSLFGHSCWRRGQVREFSIPIEGQVVRAVGNCTFSRPSNEGGMYLGFSSPLQSLYAYA